MTESIAEFVLRLLAWLGGAALVLVAVLRWAADRLATRLEQGWQHRYDTQLEVFRGQLSQSRALVDLASQTIQSAYLGGLERRAQAAEKLWDAVLKARQQDFSPLEIVDIIPHGALEKVRVADLFIARTVNDAAKHVVQTHALDREVERFRPFLSQEAWLLFRSLRAFQTQMYVELVSSFEKDSKLKSVHELFNASDGPSKLLSTVLPQEVVDRVRTKRFGIYQSVRERLEEKILAAITQHLAGSEGSKLAVEEASRLLEIVNASERSILQPHTA